MVFFIRIYFSLFISLRFVSCEYNYTLLGIPSSQRTVAFEKACILFNLAGLYTQIATKQDRSTEKGLDIAVDNFLRAAGIFKHIHETFTNAPSIDLKPQFLEILVALMLVMTIFFLFHFMCSTSFFIPLYFFFSFFRLF